MSSRPVVVLCEGTHDIAFLIRLLTSDVTAKIEDCPVRDLPSPFNKLFIQRFEARSATAAKLSSKGPVLPDEPPLLEAVVKSNDESRIWYFLNCCGDSRYIQVNSFLDLLITLTQIAEPDRRLSELAVVFVNDADEMGVEARNGQIVENYKATMTKIIPDFHQLKPNSAHLNGGFGVGSVIFCDPSSSLGTLENIVWPMMVASADERHHASHELMSRFAVAGTKIGPATVPSKKLKAALATAGQPFSPGSSLAVILRESVDLTPEGFIKCRLSQTFLTILKGA